MHVYMSGTQHGIVYPKRHAKEKDRRTRMPNKDSATARPCEKDEVRQSLSEQKHAKEKRY